MSIHFCRPVRTHTFKVNDADVEPVPAVRLYCSMLDTVWTLQVRGPISRRDRSIGKDFIVASASLEKDDMVALRDSIDAFLKEHA